MLVTVPKAVISQFFGTQLKNWNSILVKTSYKVLVKLRIFEVCCKTIMLLYKVLTKAGGNSTTTSLFTQATGNQNIRLPHRALQMCAFQIGLYALGLHNRVSPNWLSRTYSSHTSWITGNLILNTRLVKVNFRNSQNQD